MRALLFTAVVAAGCGKTADPPAPAPVRVSADATVVSMASAKAYPDLAAALAATIPSDARVIGFGELHARSDRTQVRSALERFTRDGLPGLADRLSDLVIETWIPARACGAAGTEATARVEIAMRRPIETKNEIALLAEAARAAKVQPRAMTISCDDYARVAPAGKEVDPVALLALATRELGRVSSEALAAREAEPGHRPWIAVYGGALHNDRFPEPGTEEWSYAAGADRATGGKFVEVDLIVPEYADDEPMAQRQPWFPLVTDADAQVHVWRRGERSFVIVLPRTPRDDEAGGAPAGSAGTSPTVVTPGPGSAAPGSAAPAGSATGPPAPAGSAARPGSATGPAAGSAAAGSAARPGSAGASGSAAAASAARPGLATGPPGSAAAASAARPGSATGPSGSAAAAASPSGSAAAASAARPGSATGPAAGSAAAALAARPGSATGPSDSAAAAASAARPGSATEPSGSAAAASASAVPAGMAAPLASAADTSGSAAPR